jgi:hypothetical protein
MNKIDWAYIKNYLVNNSSAIRVFIIDNVKIVETYADILEPRVDVFKLLYEDYVRILIKKKKIKDISYSIFSPEFKNYYYLIKKDGTFTDINGIVTSNEELRVFIRKQKIKEIFND